MQPVPLKIADKIWAWEFVDMATYFRSNGQLRRAREDKCMISSYLEEERHLGRVMGHLEPDRFPTIHCSAIGLIPKGSSGKWRLIVAYRRHRTIV